MSENLTGILFFDLHCRSSVLVGCLYSQAQLQWLSVLVDLVLAALSSRGPGVWSRWLVGGRPRGRPNQPTHLLDRLRTTTNWNYEHTGRTTNFTTNCPSVGGPRQSTSHCTTP